MLEKETPPEDTSGTGAMGVEEASQVTDAREGNSAVISAGRAVLPTMKHGWVDWRDRGEGWGGW